MSRRKVDVVARRSSTRRSSRCSSAASAAPGWPTSRRRWESAAALVFYHFGTKDKLFAAALEHAADRDLARLERTVARATYPLERCAACWPSTPRRGRARLDDLGRRLGRVAAVAGHARPRAAHSTCGGRTCSQAIDPGGVARDVHAARTPTVPPGAVGAARRACRAGDRPPQPDQARSSPTGCAAPRRASSGSTRAAASERTASSTSHHPVGLRSPGRSARGAPSRRLRCPRRSSRRRPGR